MNKKIFLNEKKGVKGTFIFNALISKILPDLTTIADTLCSIKSSGCITNIF